MTRRALILMTKAPVPGRVKTRLASTVGDRRAAALQEAFLLDLGRRFASLDARCVLACAPNSEHPVFETVAQWGWERWTQGDGDLGVRLQRALERAFEEGAQQVVFLGSDSPTLPLDLVVGAFEALEDTDAVLGPVFDGGYYLVGLSRTDTPVFEDIPWGTEHVFRSTATRLGQEGVPFSVLPFWYDVDDEDDLTALRLHLGLPGPFGPFEAPHTRALLGDDT